MEWTKKYLNLPYKNHNCFEYVVKILNEEFNFPIKNLNSTHSLMIQNYPGINTIYMSQIVKILLGLKN